MTTIIANAELAHQIEAATGGVAIVNDQGATIALCLPVKPRSEPKYTPDEIERRRRDLAGVRELARTHPERGKSLAEVMANLHRLAGDKP
jgi:hypothetical protein